MHVESVFTLAMFICSRDEAELIRNATNVRVKVNGGVIYGFLRSVCHFACKNAVFWNTKDGVSQ